MNFNTMSKTQLREACKAAGISYSKLNNDGMRAALSEKRYFPKAKQVAAVVTTPAASPKVLNGEAAPKREERNGVKRPSPGGLCAQVWDFCDHVLRTEGAAAVTGAVIKQAADDKGWNQNNASIEFYAWKRFMGLNKPRKARKAKAAPVAARKEEGQAHTA